MPTDDRPRGVPARPGRQMLVAAATAEASLSTPAHQRLRRLLAALTQKGGSPDDACEYPFHTFLALEGPSHHGAIIIAIFIVSLPEGCPARIALQITAAGYSIAMPASTAPSESNIGTAKPYG